MNRAAVAAALARGGLSLPGDVEFEFTGSEPILPSPHYLATGAAITRLLTGIGANELWKARGHKPQALSVDLRHAAAALHSYMHVKYHDESKAPPTAPRPGMMRITRIVAARSGRYMQLHGSLNDGPQILAELGLGESATAEDIDAAVAKRDAFELQDAFIRRKVCGGVVMRREEWAAHPQGIATKEWPLVRITKIGEAPPEPLPEGDRPASGIRVVDLTRVLAGPTCAKTLAEHGADVIHVSAPHLERMGRFDVETGIGKRQAYLDLNDPRQKQAMFDLIREADIFSQGYRLGTLARRGLSPEALAALRPGIVYVAENCYGHVGPWAERPGWEQLGQAATGMSFREGQSAPDGVPRLAPAAVNDYSTGYLAAYGTMMALAKRATEGGSWLVQVSLSQTCRWYQDFGDDNDFANADRGDLTPFLAEMDTDHFGRISYLTPALTMSETQPYWDTPPRLQGSDEAVWLPR
jgi:hypothetical protein